MRRSRQPAGQPVSALPSAIGATAQSKEPVKIGLTAAVSGGSAASGEAIKRGLADRHRRRSTPRAECSTAAHCELVVRDDEGKPAKGVTIARELVEREKVAAVFGGLHTRWRSPRCRCGRSSRTPYMGAWAAGTNITRNGQSPNYVFRVSANDDYVDRSSPATPPTC